MHELSLSRSILDNVLEKSHSQPEQRIYLICLRIGKLMRVDQQALRFGFEVLARGSVAEGAELKVEEVPAQAECTNCAKRFTLDNYFDPCPYCQTHGARVLQGEEMIIQSMEMA